MAPKDRSKRVDNLIYISDDEMEYFTYKISRHAVISSLWKWDVADINGDPVSLFYGHSDDGLWRSLYECEKHMRVQKQ